MKNEFIDYCNDNSIQDGVLREFLTKNKTEASLQALEQSLYAAKEKVIALEKLYSKIQTQHNPT